MSSTRDDALAVLGLGDAASEPDAEAVQRAFERLARRYPQASFPEKFRRLLEARDTLLDAERGWRELLAGRSLNLAWLPPYMSGDELRVRPRDERDALQRLLRAAFLAEPIGDSRGNAAILARLSSLLPEE